MAVLLLTASSLPGSPLELAGITVTPHVRAESMRYRRPPDPEMAARVQLFIRNASTNTLTLAANTDLRFDDQRPADLLAQGQWAWHDTPDCWPGKDLELAPDAITVWTFNGRTDAWGIDTRHRLTLDQNGARLLDTELSIQRPEVWLSAVSFLDVRANGASIIAHVVNESDWTLCPAEARTWQCSTPGVPRSLDRRSVQLTNWGWGNEATTGFIQPRDRGWARIKNALGPGNGATLTSHVVLELLLKQPDGQPVRWASDRHAVRVWAHLRVRQETFDISGGWVGSDVNGRQALTLVPYLKTLKGLHINTGHIAETPGYSDNPFLYGTYPLKYFNKLQPFEVYDTPEQRRRIHAVEFLGEPQYGGGRPVPPQEVFQALQPYRSTRLPTTVTHSEERVWRWYAGLSDYPHYDAYRVTAPAADAWRNYDRWGDQRIGWGAPLETIGDMTRSLREMYRPAAIAYWSQGAHHGWEVYGGRRRTSPTPDELRLQAYHALANRITSLYWFNLSLKSLVNYRDLLEPIQQVGREIRMLEDFYVQGDAFDSRRIDRDGRPDWDCSVIAAPQGALLFALDLDYHPDPEEKVFRFGEPRPAQFAFRLPGYLRQPVDAFRVDADGIHDVDWTATTEGVTINETLSRVGIYVAAREKNLRAQLGGKHRRVLSAEALVGFDPAHSDVDFALLKGLLDLPAPRARGTLDSELEQWLASDRGDPKSLPDVSLLDAAAQHELLARHRESVSITEQCRLLRALAGAGNSEVAGLVANALTRSYVGRSVSRREEKEILALLFLLARVARRDDAALEFLLSGVQPEFWMRFDYWTTEWRAPLSRLGYLNGLCVQALPYIQSPEAQAVLDDLRDRPERAWELGIDSARVDAAYTEFCFRNPEWFDKPSSDVHHPQMDWSHDTEDGRWWRKWRAPYIHRPRPQAPAD